MKRAIAAIEVSGVVKAHGNIIIGVAKKHNSIILVRPVNKASTSLIEEGFATKDLHIKGKSADWGPQSGFICCDQAFSKLARKPSANIPSSNQQVKQSINGKFAKPVPLVITLNRIQELVKSLAIKIISIDKGVYKVASMGKPHKIFLLFPHARMPTGPYPLMYKKYQAEIIKLTRLVPKLKLGYWVLHEQFEQGGRSWKEMMVLAEHNSGIPLTADYDLFCICPHLSKSPRSSSASNKFLHTAKSVQFSLGQKERRINHPDFGRTTLLNNNVKDSINHGVRGLNARNVVHHGCEVDNPVTELDYPITAFTPWGEIVAAQNQSELESVVRDILRLGHTFYSNRLWSQAGKITSTTQANRDYKWNDRIQESMLSSLEVFKNVNHSVT